MREYKYLAFFSKENANDKGYTVTFPDLPGCITEGDTFNEAFENAQDALRGHLYCMEEDGDIIPPASDYSSFELPSPSTIVSLIPANMEIVYRQMNSKAIRKTVSIPKWMADMADESNISLSKVLQDSLKNLVQ